MISHILKLVLLASLTTSSSLLIALELDGATLTKNYCSECHESDGNSKSDKAPKIAGFSAILVFDILDQFKTGDRKAEEIENKNKKLTNMLEISKKLKEEEREAIALYLSEQTFKPAKQVFDKQLALIGKQLHQDLCNDCHTKNGTSPAEDAPILAGQWKKYLVQQFDQFSSHKRYMPKRMKRKFRKLSDNDKIALIEFYSSAP